ncbi:MAG: hypothetical protein HYV95_00265 [Opitutae bacterium]|nr:hypothetical protein [Opitutae bacterium]
MLAGAGYAINRWLIPLSLKGVFLRGHFADALLIPAALPPWLWVQRKTGLRHTDAVPGWTEIAWHLIIWSIAAEAVAPFLFARATGDVWDVVSYAAGAVVAGLYWQRQ